MRTAEALPELFTARYLAGDAIAGFAAVPVGISMRPPVVPLAYPLEESARTLVPEPWMVGEWPWLSPAYWRHLDGRGTGEISAELAATSDRHGGRPLVLLDHEDVTRGHRSLRTVFAQWWEEQTGQEVFELADDGRALHFSQLHKRTRPKRPKRAGEDRRWTDDEPLGWPVSHEEFGRWARGRHWQFARTMRHNPHHYTHRAWGDEGTFLRAVMHLRENGRQEVYGGDLYTYYVADGLKFWTMGADLMSTILINRKPVGQDGGDPEETTEAPNSGRAPVEAPLFDGDGRPLTLAQRINHEHRACALATGAAVRHAIRCGELLAQAKAGVPHGRWLPWLGANTDLAPRTAQLYMKLHREAEPDGAETTPGSASRGPNTQRITHLHEEPERRESA